MKKSAICIAIFHISRSGVLITKIRQFHSSLVYKLELSMVYQTSNTLVLDCLGLPLRRLDVDDDEADDRNCISFDVGVLDLLDFGGRNLMRNGDQVYKSSHLLELGVVSYGEETCKLEGLCTQSSHPGDAPHTITIDTARDFNRWKFHCTCKAGNGGRCKHLYAALLHINIEKNLEVITCTQRKQNWGKVAKEEQQCEVVFDDGP